MADLITDGMTRVGWITTISNKAAPTTTELNAGILLHDLMTAAGLIGFGPDTAATPTSKFSAVFNTNKPGRVNYSGSMLEFCKQDGTDTIYNTLPYGTVGFVAIRRGLAAATAWLSTQKLEIYPATTGERIMIDPEENTLQRWRSPLFIHDSPNLNAVVA